MRRTWLMKCFPSSEDMDWGRYGVLTFDDKWLKKLWELEAAVKVAKKTVPSLSELVVWDYQLSFYDKVELTEEQEERLDKYDYIENNLPTMDDDHLTRTECEELHIIDDAKYIYWSVLVKHTDVRADSPRIALADFECQLHGRNPRKRRTCFACIAGA